MRERTGPRAAVEIVDLALKPKPELIIHAGNLPATAEALRDLLAASGSYSTADYPCASSSLQMVGHLLPATPLTKHNVVMEAHRLCQPMKINSEGEHVPVTLLDRVSQMYLDMTGEPDLPPLAGVCTAPLLSAVWRRALGMVMMSGPRCGALAFRRYGCRYLSLAPTPKQRLGCYAKHRHLSLC